MERHEMREGGRRAPGEDASMTDLVARLAQETRRYVELQIDLAKMQALQGLAGAMYDGLKIAVAAGLLTLAGLCLVVAFALAISAWVGSYWIGVLITGLLLSVVGGVALWLAVGTSFLLNIIPKDLRHQVRVLSRGPRE